MVPSAPSAAVILRGGLVSRYAAPRDYESAKVSERSTGF
jgi:hypothetical protein